MKIKRYKENSLTLCWSHKQDGCHAHIWYKHSKNLLSRNQWANFDEHLIGNKRQRLKLIIFCSNDNWVDLDIFYSKVKFCNLGFYIGKCDTDGFF